MTFPLCYRCSEECERREDSLCRDCEGIDEQISRAQSLADAETSRAVDHLTQAEKATGYLQLEHRALAQSHAHMAEAQRMRVGHLRQCRDARYGLNEKRGAA